VYRNDGNIINRLRSGAAQDLSCPPFRQDDLVELEISFEERLLRFRNGAHVQVISLPVSCRLRLAACMDYTNETVLCTGQVHLGPEMAAVLLPSSADTKAGHTRCLLADSLSVEDLPDAAVLSKPVAPLPIRIDFSQFHPTILEGLTNLLAIRSLHQNPLLTLKALRIFQTILHDNDARRLYCEHNSEFVATLAKLIMLCGTSPKTVEKEWQPTPASFTYAKARCTDGDQVLLVGRGQRALGMVVKISTDAHDSQPYKVCPLEGGSESSWLYEKDVVPAPKDVATAKNGPTTQDSALIAALSLDDLRQLSAKPFVRQALQSREVQASHHVSELPAPNDGSLPASGVSAGTPDDGRPFKSVVDEIRVALSLEASLPAKQVIDAASARLGISLEGKPMKEQAAECLRVMQSRGSAGASLFESFRDVIAEIVRVMPASEARTVLNLEVERSLVLHRTANMTAPELKATMDAVKDALRGCTVQLPERQ